MKTIRLLLLACMLAGCSSITANHVYITASPETRWALETWYWSFKQYGTVTEWGYYVFPWSPHDTGRNFVEGAGDTTLAFPVCWTLFATRLSDSDTGPMVLRTEYGDTVTLFYRGQIGRLGWNSTKSKP